MSGSNDPTSPCRSFQEAKDFLEKAINYEKRVAWKYTEKAFDLRRMEELLAQLGNPHRALRVIHIAGTKGKGTTAALIASCLQAAGYRTGLHTSPHLVSVCERMVVDGQPASESEFCRLLGLARTYIDMKRRESRDDAPTYFETTTALAFKHFQEQQVDWAVIEVGLGGRLDSTNVVSPQCCVVTLIGFDHMDKLGDTVEKIAGEKAGIIKRAVPVVLANQKYPRALGVLRERADAMGCPRWEVGREVTIRKMQPLAAPLENPEATVGWRFSLNTPRQAYKDFFCPLLGAHQVENCATAVGTLQILADAGELKIEPDAVKRGIASCRWPARVELLQRRPVLVLDAAHTVESVEALLAALEAHFPGRPLRMVFGCSQDKNYEAMLRLIVPRCTSLITTQANSPRAMDAQQLGWLALQIGLKKIRAVISPPEAVRECLRATAAHEIVSVTGSFFVAGEVAEAWQKGVLP